MKKYAVAIIIALSLVFLALFNFTYNPSVLAKESNPNSYYQEKAIHSRDGMGKFYLGREIAQVMGHQAMLWLERPSRETEEQPQAVVEALDLKSNDVVADIGAGTGYMSFRMANLVPEGKVFCGRYPTRNARCS